MRLAASCLLFFSVVTPASAEWYADLYGGFAYTPRSDVVLVVGSATGPADHTFHNVAWTTSGVLGGRAGYWFDRAPWYGIGLDIFRFDADIPTQVVDTTIQGTTAPATLRAIDIAVTAVALDVVRLRHGFLANTEYPKGRLQPYITAGPALFRVQATNRQNGELTTRSASDTSIGYKVGAGLSWRLAKNSAIFGEYRYTHFRAEPVLQGAITGASVPMRFDLNTHHFVAGVSFLF
jgi:opacity protein-like surface antigen